MKNLTECVEFGEELLATRDLDPVYCMLVDANLHPDLLMRWCLAYWCFYHVGVSSLLSQRKGDFYDEFENIIRQKGGPRGSERRHFRGEKTLRTLERFKEIGHPEAVVAFLCGGGTCEEVKKRAETIPLFGPWIAFKVADMAERVINYPVRFDISDVELYKNPRQGASIVLEGAIWSISDEEVREVMEAILDKMGHLQAPPLYDRVIGVQEVETILCKYKSFKKGTYWVGKDIKEIRESAEKWAHKSSIAARLLESAPHETR